jgi:hypothetical protein
VAGLGVSVLGLHSVGAGMKISARRRVSGASEHGHHALWRRKVSGIDCQGFGRFILRAVHENELDRPLSQPTVM